MPHVGRSALLVQVLTDNRNRAASDVRHMFTHGGGTLAASNAVAWMFEKKGVVTIEGVKNADELELELIDAGADDFKTEGSVLEVYCASDRLRALRESLEKRKIVMTGAELAWIAKTPAQVNDDQAVQTMKLMELLEEHDDVQKVYSNLDITDAVMAKYEGNREQA
jgi:YebC/PmpR family DNA-binding regulatory protein